MNAVTVVGAGLAGSEAAYQLAIRSIPVRLIEMKPKKMTPAHVSPYFAELVCSNSLRSDELTNAVGLLKEELRRLGSIVMRCADEHRVAAGGALAVDREGFARAVTEAVRALPNVEIVEEEAVDIPNGEVIIASGPLTSDALAENILRRTGGEGLHFYDAVAPIVSLDSVDMESAFRASRYDKGTADYVNCPMTEEEYTAFWKELTTAREAAVHGFDDGGVFEGCMPVEVMARRGFDTLRYGPMKPVGLRDPHTGHEPYAVVQLRQDNADARLTPLGHEIGLISDRRYALFCKKQERIEGEIKRLEKIVLPPSDAVLSFLKEHGSTPISTGAKFCDLLKRPELDYRGLISLIGEEQGLTGQEAEEVEILIKYEGYIARQQKQVEQFKKLEERRLPEGIDYEKIDGLRIEARQKLVKMRPSSIGQAGRISGVSPADISVLLVYLEQNRL